MELLYHYLWKHRLFGLKPALESGEPVEVLDPGLSNSDAGPDFFNAKVRIADTEWIGNVEIHTKSSDWYRHRHDTDPHYDSVILHVVGDPDCTVSRTDGTPIPQMKLSLPKELYLTYSELKTDLKAVRCSRRLQELSSLVRTDWIESLAIERLTAKAGRILQLLSENGGDWNTTTFVTLARGLGFGLNAEPFEMLARSIPLRYILRHSDNLLQTEALLFGQAGLIPTGGGTDPYAEKLEREYRFLKMKYGLRPIPENVWRFARTRPQNFPHRRIALLATTLLNGFPLPGKLREAAGAADSLRKLFLSWSPGQYWREHYAFGTPSAGKMTALTRRSADLLLINVVTPYLYALAARTSDLDLGEKAREMWLGLPPERNSIISGWEAEGLKAGNAFDSQGLLQLRREYCDRSRCLQCRFGHILLRKILFVPNSVIL